jgi:hypothetical protein
MTPTAKRRWSYSLRTLFVVVTVLAGLFGVAIGWQRHTVKSVEDRRNLLTSIGDNGGRVLMRPPTLIAGDPLLRFPYGDQAVAVIFLPKDVEESKLQQIVDAFPEASVKVGSQDGTRRFERRMKTRRVAN